MKITITLNEALEFVRKAIPLDSDYELAISDLPTATEPAPVMDIDWALVEQARVKTALQDAQKDFDGMGKIWCCEDMRSSLVESMVKDHKGVPYILSFPAHQWQGTTYQEAYDAEQAEKKAAEVAAEKARVEAARKKIENEVAEQGRKTLAKMQSDRYKTLEAKYGERTNDYEQWKIWEEEEEAFDKLKANEAADIKFYEDAGIPLPFTPKYQSGKDSMFRIDGMTSEEYQIKKREDREAAEKQQAETMALLDSNPDLVMQMAGKEPSELFKQLEEAKKAAPVTKKTSSLFQPVEIKLSKEDSVALVEELDAPVQPATPKFMEAAKAYKEKIVEQEPIQEDEPVFIPVANATTSSPFAGFKINTEETPDIEPSEHQDSVQTETESSEPAIELKEDVPVFLVDDSCPWDDDCAVVPSLI